MDQQSDTEQTADRPLRHIIHADLDAFYAAVEQLDNPELRGKPVLVGGRPEGRGVVATASYEAREYGIHSAMPMRSAMRLCPHGIIITPRFDRYREFSRRVMEIFRSLTDVVEPVSLDEAYLDITGPVDTGQAPLAVALDLKSRVREATGLTLSVGVASSKSVAKIASELNKPDGLVLVTSHEERDFLAPLPVDKLWGIGPKTAQKLNREGIHSIGDLASQPFDWFKARFGLRALSLQDKALGQDRELVHTERDTKSVSAENTFPTDLADADRLQEELARLAARVARHLEQQDLLGKTVTVKARLADFTTFSRQMTLGSHTRSEATISNTAWRLLSAELTPGRSFRLLGVGLSGFGQTEVSQLPLF